jgi:zinc protease
MPRRLTAALALSLALPAAGAAEDVTAFTLDNGLEVVVIEDHRAPLAVQMLWYRVGAADEPPGKSGIAHYLEHLMFQGTDRLAPGEFSATVERLGGDDNAFTSWDYTAYFQRIAAEHLPRMMEMEANRMRGLLLTPEDAATELRVILEERSQVVDSDPGAVFAEQRRAAAYLNHPYGTPIIGWRHEMEGLTRQDALDFYRRFYAPNNAVLVIAGDVETAAVRALAERHYGPIPPTPELPARQRPEEPPQLAERRVTMHDARVAQPYLIRSYLAPERDAGAQAEAAALTFLAALLGGNATTSTLARALQFGDAPVAVWTSAGYDGTALDSGSLSFVVMPVPGVDLATAEAALDRVLAEFLQTGPDPAEFERIRTQLRAAEIYARDDVEAAARRYGEALTTGLTVRDVQDWPALLQAVTPEDVMAAARRVLDRRQAVTGHLDRPPAAAAAGEGVSP